MFAAALMQLAGGMVSAGGNLYQGNAKGNLDDYNARIANNNANIVETQAQEAARRSLVKSSMVIGAGRAGYGASGVTADGSALDVLGASAANAALDAITIRNQGDIRATAYRNQATLDTFAGNNARVAGQISAVGSLLGAGSSMAGSTLGADSASYGETY